MNTLADSNRAGASRHVTDHWPEMARQWQQVGRPLRPAAQDVAFCEDAVREWAGHERVPRVLLLGVTPELYRLPWPRQTDFLAVDHTQAMIDMVWPGPKGAARCTDWLALALPAGSRDVVLCDGGLQFLGYPQEQRQLTRFLGSILSDQGLCILRLFVPPSERESPDAVLDDLLAGRVPNLNVLKLRLWMSMQDSAEEGVELGAMWNAIHEAAPNLAALASRIGWPLEHMQVINAYRDSVERYHIVTVDQVLDLFCGSPGGLEVHSVRVPSYEFGEQCPTVVLRRCSGAPVGRASARTER